MPVGCLGKFEVDHIADQQKLAAAKQRADDEGGERRDKYHGNTADNARDREGQNDAEKGMYVAGSQIMGSVDHIDIDLSQCVI